MASFRNLTLPAGFELGRWTIERPLSAGGFSIVYLGRDAMGRPVAIKEYMPQSLPARLAPGPVRCATPEQRARFDLGLNDFFKEAEAISRIDSPSVVRALDFFQAHGTAYLVMPFEHGRTLRSWLISRQYQLTEAELQRVFFDVLSGLRMLHEHTILHLDLKPDNVWIRANGNAMILDFGTVRIGPPDPKAPPPMYTRGYAAPEQRVPEYAPDRLGPWTDFYNLAATLYTCLEKTPPPAAQDRRVKDRAVRLQERWAGVVNERLLIWADRALSLELAQRPASAQEGLQALGYEPRELVHPLTHWNAATLESSRIDA